MTDEDNAVEQPQPTIRRRRSSGLATEPRKRRSPGQAKTALAVVETHLKGLYQQMGWLAQAVEELRKSFGN